MNEYQKYGDYTAERCSRAESAKTAVVFLAIGAGIGALLSLLLAPKSGSELRQAFRGKLDDARRGLGEQASRLRRRTGQLAGQAREKVMPIRKTR
jgi:gas vesicle protein